MFGYFKNQKLTDYICLLVLIVMIFGIEIYFFQKNSTSDDDFKGYLDIIQQIINNNYVLSKDAFPNPLYIILTILFSTITGFSLNIVGYFLIPLLSYIILGLFIYQNIIQKKVGMDNNFARDALIITLCLMLVGPISIFTFPNLYIGYIGINIYHSPTQILAQPLALGTFLLLLSGLEQRTVSKNFLLSLAAVTVLSLMAKPSYLICLIPSLFLFTAIKLYKKNFINKKLIFFFFSINFLVIAWQYWLAYGPSDPENASNIIFAPLAVVHNNSILAWQYWLNYGIFSKTLVTTYKTIFAPFFVMFHTTYSLLPRLLLSILFPATVYLTFFHTAKKASSLNLAWLTFGVALFYSCFLAESGYRMNHGNFFWGLQTSLFILFVCSAIFLIKEKNFKISKELLSIKKAPRLFFCIFIFCIHLLSGAVYYSKILCGGWFG